MHNLFNLDILDNNQTLSESTMYLKRSEDLINEMEIITEAFTNKEGTSSDPTKKTSGGLISGIAKNTAFTTQATIKGTKDAWKIYDKATEIAKNVYTKLYDIVIKLAAGIVKIIQFIVNQVLRIPELIMKGIKALKGIPEAIRSKLRGDLRLHFTADDLSTFYTSVFPAVDSMVELLDDSFKPNSLMDTFFNIFRFKKKAPAYETKLDDTKLNQKLHDKYNKIKDINFVVSSVQLNSKEVIDIYFGNVKINVKTPNGVKSLTYLESLEVIVDDTAKRKNALTKIHDNIKAIEQTKKETFNDAMHGFDERSRQIIVDNIKMISGAILCIGKIHDAINKDVKTLMAAYGKIQQKIGEVDKAKTETK